MSKRCSCAWLVLSLEFFFIASCSTNLRPRYVDHILNNVDAVPLAAVVKIEPGAVSPIGGPVNFPSVFDSPLLLFRVNITIENALKGNLVPGKTQLFYFTKASGTGPKGYLGFYGTVPYRNVILMRREHGKLRTATDIDGACGILVSSGSHPNFVPHSNHLAETIIDLLLTRGAGATDEGMSRAVFSWAPSDLSLGYACRKLLQMAKTESPVVRVSSCLQLRDILTTQHYKPEEQTAIARELGITDAKLTRWRAGQEQLTEYLQRFVITDELQPTVTPAARTMNGLPLCENEAALGLPETLPNHR